MSIGTLYAGRALLGQEVEQKITLKPLPDGSTSVTLSKPVRCRCGAPSLVFINAKGKTLCLVCRSKEQQ